jgi:lipid A 3-O-deacylase
MRRSRTPAVMCFIACLTIAAPGRAGTDSGGDAYRWGPIAIARSGADAFIAGVGAFDLQDRRSSLSAGANAEYRFGRKLFVIGPALGLVANLDGGVYGYFGLYADISIGPIVLSPQVAAGGYRQGDSIDLGGELQFRESVDLSYRFDSGSRLGVRLAHISNAGIYEDNPGAEEAYVTYAIPLGPLL